MERHKIPETNPPKQKSYVGAAIILGLAIFLSAGKIANQLEVLATQSKSTPATAETSQPQATQMQTSSPDGLVWIADPANNMLSAYRYNAETGKIDLVTSRPLP